MIAHLQNGRYGEAEILREETARLMHSQLYTADPRITGMAYGFLENVVNDQYLISHQGNTFLFHSGLFLFPEQNIGFFVSTNAVGGEGLVDALVRAFADRYFPMEKAADPIPAVDFDSRASKYAGEYYSSRNNFTGFEKIFALTTPISVRVDENKNVILSEVGEVRQFVEVEPGLLVNREHPDDKIVMKEENGLVTLYPSGPFALIKTPWYGSLNLHLSILVGGALLFLITVVRWLVSFILGMIKREPRPLLSRFARVIGALFALAYLTLFIAFLALMSDINPAYGVPDFYFATATEFKTLLALPLLIGMFGLLMLPFAVIAWINRFWTLSARLSYTFLTLVAFAILWSLTYWNLLL
jgi:hypothetical protein